MVDSQINFLANRTNLHQKYDTPYCASCHQPGGAGSGDWVYPSLFHNTATDGGGNAGMAPNLIATILLGVDRTVGGTQVLMTRFDVESFVNPLTDEQIVSISNYVLTQYGNPALRVTLQQVAEARQGGPKPFLGRMPPYMIPLAIIGIFAIVLLWVIVMYRRKCRLSRVAGR